MSYQWSTTFEGGAQDARNATRRDLVQLAYRPM
jgi:hypothetical protein